MKNLKITWLFALFCIMGVANVTAVNCVNCSDCTSKILSGNIELSADINITNSSGFTDGIDCIIVLNLANKVIDCKGHKITGFKGMHSTGSYSFIYAHNSNNISIKNCIISDIQTMMYFTHLSNLSVFNNTLINKEKNGAMAIYLSRSYNNKIHNNTIKNTSAGIYSYTESHADTFNEFYNNIISECGYGIYLSWVGKTEIKNNNISRCNNCGILMTGSRNLNFTENNVCNNAIDIKNSNWNPSTSNGTNNTCNTASNYADDGQTGCTCKCGISCITCAINKQNTTWRLVSMVCHLNNSKQQNWTRAEYDANLCNKTTNITYFMTNYSTCDFCIPDPQNTSWSLISSFCYLNDSKQQNWTRTEYDINKCNETANLTYFLTNYSICDFCIPNLINTSWILISNFSCVANNSVEMKYKKIQYDTNNCNEVMNITTHLTNYTYCNYICEGKASDVFDVVEMLEYLGGEKELNELSHNKCYYKFTENESEKINLFDVLILISLI